MSEPEILYVVCIRVVDRGEPPIHPAVTAQCCECRAKVYLAKSSVSRAKQAGGPWAVVCLSCADLHRGPVTVLPITKEQLGEASAGSGSRWTAKDAEAAVLRMLPNARMRGD